MTFAVRIERDSIDTAGTHRLASILVTYPRVVIAEAITHRLNADVWNDDPVSLCERLTTPEQSKNSASSRAIPIETMISRVNEDPYVPNWTLHQKGMQGAATNDQAIRDAATKEWLKARDYMVEKAESLHELGIAKQNVNRLLEPFAWVTQLITSSNWDNFFALRCDDAADPAIRYIARLMYLALSRSTPKVKRSGQWHLPFVPHDEEDTFFWHPTDAVSIRGLDLMELPPLIRASAARSAWLSYCNHEKDGTQAQMDATCQRLVAGEIKHASPIEHQATPPGDTGEAEVFRSNLTGWVQARKLIRGEVVRSYRPTAEKVAAWGISEAEVDDAVARASRNAAATATAPA